MIATVLTIITMIRNISRKNSSIRILVLIMQLQRIVNVIVGALFQASHIMFW